MILGALCQLQHQPNGPAHLAEVSARSSGASSNDERVLRPFGQWRRCVEQALGLKVLIKAAQRDTALAVRHHGTAAGLVDSLGSAGSPPC